MTPETAKFLLETLSRLQLQIGAPDFEEMTAIVLKAKRELAEIIAAAE